MSTVDPETAEGKRLSKCSFSKKLKKFQMQ